MKKIYVHAVNIFPSDIDRLGHINNVSYVAWMQDAAVAHSAHNGWTWERYQELGAGFVARGHRIEYRAPGFATDRIYVETWVSDMKRVSSTRRYRVYRDNPQQLLTEAETTWAFVQLDSLAPLRIPAEVLSCFEVVAEPESND